MSDRGRGAPDVAERLGFAKQVEQAKRATAARRVPRHCWAVDFPQAPGRWPGVLTSWRREKDGWLGYVTVAVEDETGVVTISCWVPARHLQPL
jgi:hypothetical protein